MVYYGENAERLILMSDEFDYLDIQNASIRKRAKKEFMKGLIWFMISLLSTFAAFSNGKIFAITIILMLWSFYKIFLASKFYVLGRDAINFPKNKEGPTSSVVKGKIYKHKD